MNLNILMFNQRLPFICCSFTLTVVSLTALVMPLHAATQLTRTSSDTTLDNGLRLIIREDHRAPIVMTQMWYAVGSRDEPSPLQGISHLLEHMMFKGTPMVPQDKFTRLNHLYGGSSNAYTSNQYTYSYQLYPSQYLGLALKLEADRMQHLSLNAADLATELKVVMEERRQRVEDHPRNLAFERFKWMTYPTSHSRQPTLGLMKNLNNIQLSDVQHWYQTWYRPPHATLVIVGDVDTEQALAQVQRYFAPIPSARHQGALSSKHANNKRAHSKNTYKKTQLSDKTTAMPHPTEFQLERNDDLEFDRIGYRQLPSTCLYRCLA